MATNEALFTSLRRYARTMAGSYDLTDVLHQLTAEVTEVLGVTGAGIVLAAEDERLRYATASSEDIAVLERQQENDQLGPCAEAFERQMTVTVEDIRARSDWPSYRKEAERLGFRSVAGLPLSLRAERLGALNLYDRGPRAWTDAELDPARLLADMAAGYMIHAQLEDSRRTAVQLQQALDSRVVIEQAKGILSADLGISVDDAFDLLRRHARTNHATLRAVAVAVVEEGFRPAP
jgi:GAF domain-containing protein